MNRLKIYFPVAFLASTLGLIASSIWFLKSFASPDAAQRKNVQITRQSPAAPAAVDSPLNSEDAKFRLNIPKAEWEGLFFKDINERIKISKLFSLRLKALPKDDLEIRVWRGFGESLLEGFVLKRTNDEWSAIDLGWTPYRSPREYQQATPRDKKLNAPVSGWDTAWQKLMQAGILTLPDAAEINCSPIINDGMSYVAEYNFDNNYRTFLYDNPDYATCDEARQMIEINKIISDEFYKGKFNLSE